MILDKFENMKNYFGYSPAMDNALYMISKLNMENCVAGTRLDICEGAYVKIMNAECKPRDPSFEYHKDYIDIHAPLEGEEKIALVSIDKKPADASYDAAKDAGRFMAEADNTVTVPAGWFCITFPEDGHLACLGDEPHVVKKAVGKVHIR